MEGGGPIKRAAVWVAIAVVVGGLVVGAVV
jgi:hypothetical protein